MVVYCGSRERLVPLEVEFQLSSEVLLQDMNFTSSGLKNYSRHTVVLSTVWRGYVTAYQSLGSQYVTQVSGVARLRSRIVEEPGFLLHC